MRLSNVIILALVAATPALGRAECPPTVVIGGPSNLAQSLTKALVGRGVQVEPAGLPAGTCPQLDVEVSPAPGGLAVRITDPWGRRADRALANVLTAATLIEAWARMDLLTAPEAETSTTAGALPVGAPIVPATPIIPGETGEASAAAPLAVETATRAAAADETAPAPVEAIEAADPAPDLAAQEEGPLSLAPERSHLLIDLGAEMGVGRDRRTWTGTALTACVRVGFVCAGALGRFSFSGDDALSADGLGLLAVPIRLGRLTVVPAVAAGVGTIHREGERGGRGEGRGRGGDDQLALRVEARLGLSLRLTETLHLQVGGSASAALQLEGRGSTLGDPADTIVRGSVGILWGAP